MYAHENLSGCDVSRKLWTAECLARRLQEHRAWAPEPRSVPARPINELVPAAVLIPILCASHTACVLLTVRASQLKDNPSDVSFPGGKALPQDVDAVETALREAHEEIGLRGSDVELTVTLPPYLTHSGFAVTPVVGLIRNDVVLNFNTDEVQTLIQVPLEELLDAGRYVLQETQGEHDVRRWYSFQCESNGIKHEIWGITAGIARNLRQFLLA